MPNWVHRTTKEFLRSVPLAKLPEPEANYIEEPDLSAVTGFDKKHWTITGDVVSLMSQAERDAVDEAEETARLDAIADEIDAIQTYSRAFAEVVLDEFNSHALKINAILDAIDSSNNLSEVKTAIEAISDYPQRTLAQLKTALRGKL